MYRFLAPGQQLNLEIAVPDRGRFATFARIIRLERQADSVEEWELGVEFEKVPKKLAEILDRQVTSHSLDYSHPFNFDHAIANGSRAARSRLTLARIFGWISWTKSIVSEILKVK